MFENIKKDFEGEIKIVSSDSIVSIYKIDEEANILGLILLIGFAPPKMEEIEIYALGRGAKRLIYSGPKPKTGVKDLIEKYLRVLLRYYSILDDLKYTTSSEEFQGILSEVLNLNPNSMSKILDMKLFKKGIKIGKSIKLPFIDYVEE